MYSEINIGERLRREDKMRRPSGCVLIAGNLLVFLFHYLSNTIGRSEGGREAASGDCSGIEITTSRQVCQVTLYRWKSIRPNGTLRSYTEACDWKTLSDEKRIDNSSHWKSKGLYATISVALTNCFMDSEWVTRSDQQQCRSLTFSTWDWHVGLFRLWHEEEKKSEMKYTNEGIQLLSTFHNWKTSWSIYWDSSKPNNKTVRNI